MRRREFLDALRQRLSGLSAAEIAERVSFYQEMIEDRMEEGIPEEEAVREIGSLDEIVSSTLGQLSASRSTVGRAESSKGTASWRRRCSGGTVLFWVGSIVWIPLLVSALAVLLALYLVLWAMVISLWAGFAAVAGTALGGAILGIFFAANGNGCLLMAMLGTACACAGLSIFFFFGCREATKGVARLTPVILRGIGRIFVKKEGK